MTTTRYIDNAGDPVRHPVVKAWFLRSHADHDTHRGSWNSGEVHADCGISFRPQFLAIRSYALKGYPSDPDQICPRCRPAPTPPPTQAGDDS